MNSLALRIVAVLVGVAVVAVALALYINKFLREPEPVAAPATAPGRAEITLGTTPAVGSLGGHPTWVSYLARRGGGWDHTTTYSIQGVDPEGVFRAAIEQVRPDHGGRPVALAERLAEAGITDLAAHLEAGKPMREYLQDVAPPTAVAGAVTALAAS